MIRVTDLAHDAVRCVVAAGETVIDATAGNGHDTVFLSRLVGPEGRVFSLDIQAQALATANRRLFAERITNVIVIQCDHAGMGEVIPADIRGKFGAVMFNLGYLPGSEKTIVTQAETTIPAVNTGLRLVRPGGVITLAVYIGHPGGASEFLAVSRFLGELSPADYQIRQATTPGGPVLFTIHKTPSCHGWTADGSGQEGHDEQDQEHEEQDPRDVNRAGRDATEPEDGRDERNHQEKYRPT